MSAHGATCWLKPFVPAARRSTTRPVLRFRQQRTTFIALPPRGPCLRHQVRPGLWLWLGSKPSAVLESPRRRSGICPHHGEAPGASRHVLDMCSTCRHVHCPHGEDWGVTADMCPTCAQHVLDLWTCRPPQQRGAGGRRRHVLDMSSTCRHVDCLPTARPDMGADGARMSAAGAGSTLHAASRTRRVRGVVAEQRAASVLSR